MRPEADTQDPIWPGGRDCALVPTVAHTHPTSAELTPDDVAFLEAVRAGKASLDQGRVIPFELVRPWLLSWGTENELSPPECP